MTKAVPLMKFTPSAQDPAILEAITVQREPLIADIVDRALDLRGGRRHDLLVGPRGIGKTHIMSLVASRVRARGDGSGVVVAWLEEDPWAVRTYAKLLAAVVAAVGAELEDARLLDQAARLRAGNTDDAALAAEETLRSTLADRRLLLLVENLDDIFRRIGGQGQASLRALAEDWPQLLIVATTTQLFAGIRQHTSPFYGFFAITHVDELSLDSATELLRRVATLKDDRELRAFLDTPAAAGRIAAAEALAGGHPRIWLLLAGCVSVAAIDDLVPLFLEALDDLTPYYQDRLRELGDQQQEIVVLLAEAGGSLSNGTLAERSGISANQVATILRQLNDRGYVRRAEIRAELDVGDRRATFWELREPLMRLCLDVKQARGEPLRIIVEFLKGWYGARLLDELARLPPTAELASAYASEAFRTLGGAIAAEDLLRGSPHEIVARADLGLSLISAEGPLQRSLSAAKATGLVLEHRYAEARDLIDQLLEGMPHGAARVPLMVLAAEAGAELGIEAPWDAVIDEAAALIAAGSSDLDVQDLAAYAYVRAGRLDEARETLERRDGAGDFTASSWHDLAGALTALGRLDDALAAAERAATLAPDVAQYQFSVGSLLAHAERREEALAAVSRAVELAPSVADFRGRQGSLLGVLERYEEAAIAFQRAAELEPTQPQYQGNLAGTLVILGRLDEAEAVLDRALTQHLASDVLLVPLGFLHRQAGRREQALDAFRAAAESNPRNHTIRAAVAELLGELGRSKDAVAEWRAVIELAPADGRYRNAAGLQLMTIGRIEQALEEFDRAIALDPASARYHSNRGDALIRLARADDALVSYREAAKLAPTIGFYQNDVANTLRALGRLEEAERAARSAVDLQASEPVYRFTLAEVLLSRGEVPAAIASLGEALKLWRERGARGRPGDVELLCQILWAAFLRSSRLADVVQRVVATYREVDAATALGTGLVSTVSALVDEATSAVDADAWLDAWSSAVDDDSLDIPLNIVRAACKWKSDRDRAHILALPAEQREILISLLPKQSAEPA
jgi:tetratricopeptide (TPR) repeat protein